VGLGSSIPAVVAYLVFPDQVRAGTEGYWWKLPSPFLSVSEAMPFPGGRIDTDFVEACFWFLCTWGILVSLGCLPWFIGQIRRFYPQRRAEPLTAVLVEGPAVEPVVAATNGALTEAEPARVEPAPEHVTSIQPG
jgi:hypothetical protein